MFDTIVAISTGMINQPISIIRLSGPDAFLIVKKIFTGKEGKNKTITYGLIREGESVIDEVLVSWFKSPNTFTGEDIVEINAHGGQVNTNKILELCITNGARIAERGEFSRRAFLNGKMDLVKAEAIHDLIFAKTETQTKIAIKKFDGETSSYIEKIKNKLLQIIATIETNIDYPEYDDIEKMTQEVLYPKLRDVKFDLEKSIELSQDSRYINEGIKLAIVGKPNSGKSTLLNSLINEDKAIVTDVPGTTRDIVEGELIIDGILIKLIDTAGIHATNDFVEKKGIEKSLDQINKADVIVHLLDPLSENDSTIDKLVKEKVYLKVWNKSDVKHHDGISISAKQGHLKPLIAKIRELIPNLKTIDTRLIFNSRQQSLVRQAHTSIVSAITSLSNNFLPDEVIIDIRNAWEELANITGKVDNESLLDEMFKNFCLGK